MKGLTLSNLEKACGGTLYYAKKKTQEEAACVVIDSRRIEAGGVFIATKGERVDGHSFIPQVFEKGAMAVVCEQLPEQPYGPCILVKDSFRALTAIASFYRQQLDCTIVGITGSVGKTSTKELIASVLRSGYETCSTEGNFNNEIGVPLTILRIREQHKYAVVEMGINHFGEMTRLSAIVKPDIAVLTNIGDCHLEALGDRPGVLRAKTEIFASMNAQGTVVINGMDDQLCTIGEVNGKRPIRYALQPEGCADGKEAAYTAEVAAEGALEGSDVWISGPDGLRFQAHVPLPGRHMVLNALAATAVGCLAGLNAEQIKKGIESVQAVGGRSRIVSAGAYTLIDDCYNANPTSMRAAIDLLCRANGRKAAVLGDMFELGAEELALHAGVGRYAKEKAVDVLLCAGKLSEAMAEAAAGMEVYHFASTEELREHAAEYLQPGDTVLIKASHGMHFEQIVEHLTAQDHRKP